MSKENIYYCSIKGNTCPIKDDCYRYTELKRNNKLPNTTLYLIKNQDNKCKLFIRDKNNLKEGKENAGE